MKKIIFSLFFVASLSAAPQAVVFDWGNVLAFPDRKAVIDFLCKSLQLSESEVEKANLEKKNSVKNGMSEAEFWVQFAKKKKIVLPQNWPEVYQATIKSSVGADPEMYALVDELKQKKITVGLLSNIDDRYTKLIQSFGFYKPFEPCLLSCEIGLAKPDPKAYQLLLKKLNLPADQVVFIDDKSENVEGAKKEGIDAILFESPKQVREQLQKRGAL